MPVYFSDIWNMYLYNREEDPAEAYVIIPLEPPVLFENEQPVDNISDQASSSNLDVSDEKISNAEKGDISNHEFSAKRVSSSLLNESQHEHYKYDSVETDASFLKILADSSSPVLDASDTKTPNAEKGDIRNSDSSAERGLGFLDENKNEAESRQFKSDFVATDTSFSKISAANESLDSNGEISRNSPQTSNKSIQISTPPVDDKLRRKLFMFETIATVIGLTAPTITIGIGVENIGNCPADFLIPYLVLMIGVLSLLIVSYAFVKSHQKIFDYWKELDENVIFKTSTILAILWLGKDVRFFAMDPSFNSMENYCNFKFYIFNIYLDVLLGLGYIIGFYLLVLHSKRRLNPSTLDDGHFMKFD